jgi:hypothetical protein
MKPHQEIYDFFIQNGNKKWFEISDTPLVKIGNLDGNTFPITQKPIMTESINGIKDFISRHLNDTYSTVYIYSEQNFSDDMRYIRYYKYIPDKCIERSLKLKSIKDKLNEKYLHKS